MKASLWAAIWIMASAPALAEMAPYQGSVGRIFPTLEPYCPRCERPDHGSGQPNPEYVSYDRTDRGGLGDRTRSADGDGGLGALGGWRAWHGSTVAVGGGVQETIQGIRQDEGRSIDACTCAGTGNYDSITGGTGTSYK